MCTTAKKQTRVRNRKRTAVPESDSDSSGMAEPQAYYEVGQTPAWRDPKVGTIVMLRQSWLIEICYKERAGT